MSTHDDILNRFAQIRTWSNRERRAPNKPLLIIWMVGRCLRGEARLTAYELVDSELKELLRYFGRPGHKRPDTHSPFWRLKNDGLWEIDRPHLVRLYPNGVGSPKDLIHENIRGGLKASDYAEIRSNPAVGLQIVMSLLEAHFPESLHQVILRATGFDDAWRDLESSNVGDYIWTRHRRRSGRFRHRVLSAYEEQCTICGFDVRITNEPIAVEAAHIRWHSHDGPDEARNGFALCSLHHKLFDSGAFTVLPDMKMFVSSTAKGQGRDESLGQFHQGTIRVIPTVATNQPAEEFLNWHGSQVFRTPEELPSS